jgi:L-malate glycosyltransferase
MKIFHLITSLKIGGAESALCNFLEYEQNSNYEHHVAYFYGGKNVERLQNLKIPVYKMTGIFFLYDPVSIYRLIKLIKKIKPDVIHAALWSSTIIGRIVGKILGIPVICDIHGNCKHHGKFRNFLDKITLSIPQKCVAVSKTINKSFVETLKISPAKICVIENGINPKEFASKKTSKKNLKFDENDFIVGSIGRFEKIKSYDVLIKAFALFSANKQNVKLCLVGDGTEKIYLEQLARSQQIKDKVVFTGLRTDAHTFYSIFDCFVLSSASEGLSIALLEALSFGLPIVTTHINTTHDVIENGKHGFIVPVNDPKEMAHALEHLYNNNELRQSMNVTNKRLVKEKFHIKRTVSKYHKLYDEIS